LRKAFGLAVPDERALAVRDDIVFFQQVRDALSDRSTPEGQRPGALEQALRQLVSSAITPHGVVDIFSAAGLQKPDISVLSEQFLNQVRSMPQRNLAVELLQKLLNNEIRTRTARNVVQSRLFSEKLSAALRGYENRSIETAKVIEELIEIAREMQVAQARGKKLKLDDNEIIFYDALAAHGDVSEVMGDQVLADIARRLAAELRKSATVDWKLRESGRARMRLLVRRILRQAGYPPDQQESAIVTVLQQAELFADEMVA
jgi:type I restriction enzyme R subunit